MNENATSLVDQIFYPGWLMVSQLRNGQEIADGPMLYRRACEWIDRWRGQLSAAGISEVSADHMLYAICALFDESVLNRHQQDSGFHTWLANPLQAKYFRMLNAGEELWERIRSVLHEPSPDPAVLTCFYRVLQLGFTGRYRERDDERLEDVVQALGRQVAPFALAQDAPLVARAGRLRSGCRMYRLSWAGGIVLLAGLWLALSSSLEQLAAHITELR